MKKCAQKKEIEEYHNKAETEECSRCDGTGNDPDDEMGEQPCDLCGGSGDNVEGGDE